MARYLIHTHGHCMGEALREGTLLEVDTEAPIKPGTLCSVELTGHGHFANFLREAWEAEGQPGECPTGYAKIFIGRRETHLGEVFYLAHTNPPAIGVFRRSEIRALHAVVGAVGSTFAIPEADRLAWHLVSLARDPEPCEPINRGWRPAPQSEAA